MTKFVIDEDMPRSTGKVLQEYGYEVKDIRDFGLRGSTDEEILAFAKQHSSVVLTGDRGFGNIYSFPLGSHFGIVVAHFPNESPNAEINHQLVERLKNLTDHDFYGNLIIIEPDKIRIRRK